MAITDKIRKTLWAKSGNRCAICRKELVGNGHEKDPDVIIGEECHIISSKKLGPRHIAERSNYDQYENLILLCRNHHKEIDDQLNKYTIEYLGRLKNEHENWVKESLGSYEPTVEILPIVASGKQLVDIITNVHGYFFDHDELVLEDEATAIAILFENLQDYGDLISEGTIDKSRQVVLGLTFNDYLMQIQNLGFSVFGERRSQQTITLEGEEHKNWDVAVVHVIRNTNPGVIKTTE